MDDPTREQLRGLPDNPYHKSIGVVVLDKEKHVGIIEIPAKLFTLVRETQYFDESPEACAQRGAEEELGAIVEVERFLGTLQGTFSFSDGTKIYKSTDYFLAHKVGETPRRPIPEEENDIIHWMEIREAIRRLQTQGDVDTGANEADILERII